MTTDQRNQKRLEVTHDNTRWFLPSDSTKEVWDKVVKVNLDDYYTETLEYMETCVKNGSPISDTDIEFKIADSISCDSFEHDLVEESEFDWEDADYDFLAEMVTDLLYDQKWYWEQRGIIDESLEEEE